MISWYFGILAIFAVLALIVTFCISKTGIEKSFPDNDPASLAVLRANLIRTRSQVAIGLFVILTSIALLLETKITAEVAMSVISLVVGYILGSGINTVSKSNK